MSKYLDEFTWFFSYRGRFLGQFFPEESDCEYVDEDEVNDEEIDDPFDDESDSGSDDDENEE